MSLCRTGREETLKKKKKDSFLIWKVKKKKEKGEKETWRMLFAHFFLFQSKQLRLCLLSAWAPREQSSRGLLCVAQSDARGSLCHLLPQPPHGAVSMQTGSPQRCTPRAMLLCLHSLAQVEAGVMHCHYSTSGCGGRAAVAGKRRGLGWKGGIMALCFSRCPRHLHSPC